MIVRSDDVAGEFLWNCFSRTLCYASDLVGVIADDVVSIDNAMKWGFGWEFGPFEVLDAIGLDYFIDRLRKENRAIPSFLLEIQSKKLSSVYKWIDGSRYFYCLETKEYSAIKNHQKFMNYLSLKTFDKTIKAHWSASLVDLGDSVAGIELHSVLKP